VLVISGTGTGVGKTIVTAAIAALARADGRRVAVLKPAQTGMADGAPGDLDEVIRLAGQVTTAELGRYPEPLAPNTAARRAGLPPVRPAEIVTAAGGLADSHDVVLVEGAGGLLVRFDDEGGTLADVARELAAPVVIVARAGLGTLNEAQLTTEALSRRGIACAGVVVGEWPDEPDLAARCNLVDLPAVTGVPLVGLLPANAGRLDRRRFAETAYAGLAPGLGGTFDPKSTLDNADGGLRP
jgi:dethiobiotin synthetase